MVKSKTLVFVSEPSWMENPLPNWVNNKMHFVITESDSVINECYLRNIEVLALGEYIDSEKNIYFMNKSIEIEQFEINNFAIQFKNNNYVSEFFHGISNQLYYLFYYNEVVENLFQNIFFNNLIFVFGERFMASSDETPKGSFLLYNLFKDVCSKFNIKFIKKCHQLYSYKEIISTKKRYDFYFTINNYNNNIINKRTTDYDISSTKPKTLFIYQYEACKDDLEPLLDQDLNVSNVLKLQLTSGAPLVYEYDFDLASLETKAKQDIIEYDFKNIKTIFNKYIDFINEETLSKILLKYFIYNKKLNLLTINRINNIEKIINDFNISKLVITAFPSSTTSVIAKYFNSKNVKVILRQHGEFSSPNWPLKCFVNGVEFSTISKFYKSSIEKLTNNITITPRYYKQPEQDSRITKKNTIIITNDLFLNPTNKLLVIDFFQSFFKKIKNTYKIKLRAHPRYFGELIPEYNNINIEYENSREINLNSSFESCFLFIMPVDTFSSIISAPIGFDIPSVMIAPFGSNSVYDFKPQYFGYPFVFDTEITLIDFIFKIQNNPNFKIEVLNKQKNWLNEILNENINIKKENPPIQLKSSKQNQHLTRFTYYKIITKYLLKIIRILSKI